MIDSYEKYLFCFYFFQVAMKIP